MNPNCPLKRDRMMETYNHTVWQNETIPSHWTLVHKNIIMLNIICPFDGPFEYVLFQRGVVISISLYNKTKRAWVLQWGYHFHYPHYPWPWNCFLNVCSGFIPFTDKANLFKHLLQHSASLTQSVQTNTLLHGPSYKSQFVNQGKLFPDTHMVLQALCLQNKSAVVITEC